MKDGLGKKYLLPGREERQNLFLDTAPGGNKDNEQELKTIGPVITQIQSLNLLVYMI